MIKKKLSTTQQEKIIGYVNECTTEYTSLLADFHERMLDIYKEVNTFVGKKTNQWDTTFKVNKAHEIVNKVLPRIISRNPKRLVSNKPESLVSIINDPKLSDEQKQEKITQNKEYAKVISQLLTFIFEKYGLSEQVRMWAKEMIIYGKGIAKASFKYEVARTIVEQPNAEMIMGDDGEEEVTYKNKTEEYVWWEHPSIENVSWTKILYDPRYKDFDDLPAVIEVIEWVRLWQLKGNKKYINLDKLEALPPKEDFGTNNKKYIEAVRNIAGIKNIVIKEWVDKNNLMLTTYYGYYDTGNGESLRKFVIASGVVVICMEEILQIPFEQIRCFEDTETNLWYWFIEPIISIVRELNFKKNSVSAIINNNLYPMTILNPNSWINPKDLTRRPNGIIMTDRSIENVNANMMQLPLIQLDQNYFAESNDFERQIQSATFTIDVSSPNSQQALTNTATGARLSAWESNTVMDQIRKQLEEWLSRLSYKLLGEIFENMGEMDNIVLWSDDDESYIMVHKEAIKDALRKYDIKIEAGSSSFDSIESRRDEAIAMGNMGLQYAQAWVPVNLNKLFTDALDTFEKKNSEEYINAQPMMMDQPMGGWSVQLPESTVPTPADLTQQIAWWNILAWMQ